MLAYGVVDSIILNCPEVTAVQILFGGHEVPTLTGHLDLSRPLVLNKRFIGAVVSGDRPIGVFDFGVGGLTVLQALRENLPDEDFLYLGDTARLPYGTKTAATVRRYAFNAARHLASRDIKLLVVACNTASSFALEALAESSPVPVVGWCCPGSGQLLHPAPRESA